MIDNDGYVAGQPLGRYLHIPGCSSLLHARLDGEMTDTMKLFGRKEKKRWIHVNAIHSESTRLGDGASLSRVTR
jgi:hypothetical protein